MISADIHTHTDYFHARNTAYEMYAAAQKKGLSYFGFSEHTPLPDGFSCLIYREGDMHIAFDNYVRDVLDIKAKSEEGRVQFPKECWPKVLLGMELDFTPSHLDYMDKLLTVYPFDYVIGTIHFIGTQNVALWDCDIATEEEQNHFFESYYNETAKLAIWGKADIVAHPDFVKIHCLEKFTKWLSTKRAQECVWNALTEIKKANMVFEVSTGGLKKACKEMHPAPSILAMAAELQIPISLASDSHHIDTVAFQFDKLADFAHSYGYKEHVIFQERKPIILKF